MNESSDGLRQARLELLREREISSQRLRMLEEHLVPKRQRELLDAHALRGDGWLARRARRNTEHVLVDAERKLDREIDRLFRKHRLALPTTALAPQSAADGSLELARDDDALTQLREQRNLRRLREESISVVLDMHRPLIAGAAFDDYLERQFREVTERFDRRWAGALNLNPSVDQALRFSAALIISSAHACELVDVDDEGEDFKFTALLVAGGYFWREAEALAAPHWDVGEAIDSTWSSACEEYVNLARCALEVLLRRIRLSERSPGGLVAGEAFLTAGYEHVAGMMVSDSAIRAGLGAQLELGFRRGVAIHDVVHAIMLANRD